MSIVKIKKVFEREFDGNAKVLLNDGYDIVIGEYDPAEDQYHIRWYNDENDFANNKHEIINTITSDELKALIKAFNIK